MTRDDIIRMAREAHRDLVTIDYPGHAGQLDPWTLRLLERFATLVAAAEREECVNIGEKIADAIYASKEIDHNGKDWAEACAIEGYVLAIRARGEQK